MTMPQGSVIIVDDDDAVRNSLKFALELEGLTVRVFDGAEQLLAADLPEKGCLVVDYFMPIVNGIQLVDRLRARLIALPAILITGKVTPDLRVRAARSGFRLVLEKPLEDSTLIDAIRNALAPSAAPVGRT